MERGISLAIVLCALGGCAPDAAPVPDNRAGNVAQPTPAARAAVAASAPMRDWLAGSWSFGEECATDFLITYEADGKLDNYGDAGTWAVAGDTVTETISERIDADGETPRKLSPPERRSYTVSRIDAKHGVITYKGRKVPILRC